MTVRRRDGAVLTPYKIFVYFEWFVNESIVLSFLPPTCIAHTVAILLHAYWAIYHPPSTSLMYAIHHTILVITILYKGQQYCSVYLTALW